MAECEYIGDGFGFGASDGDRTVTTASAGGFRVGEWYGPAEHGVRALVGPRTYEQGKGPLNL